MSKTHFYGRAAAEEVLAGFLSALFRHDSYLNEARAYSGQRAARSLFFSHAARGAAHGCRNGRCHALRRRD